MASVQPLSPAQVNFFSTFGFLVMRGLFRAEIDEISRAFEEVFANENNQRWETNVSLHGEERRVIIPLFVDKHATLARLVDDPRVAGIAASLLGADYEYAQSDGNLFDCESHWHPDTYGAPMSIRHVKLSFYLDPLSADSGAIRVIPGTNFHESPFARAVRKGIEDPATIAEKFGTDPRDLPSVTIETAPGDLVVWNFRTVHASYHGKPRRRLFSINFREHRAP